MYFFIDHQCKTEPEFSDFMEPFFVDFSDPPVPAEPDARRTTDRSSNGAIQWRPGVGGEERFSHQRKPHVLGPSEER